MGKRERWGIHWILIFSLYKILSVKLSLFVLRILIKIQNCSHTLHKWEKSFKICPMRISAIPEFNSYIIQLSYSLGSEFWNINMELLYYSKIKSKDVKSKLTDAAAWPLPVPTSHASSCLGVLEAMNLNNSSG